MLSEVAMSLQSIRISSLMVSNIDSSNEACGFFPIGRRVIQC
jgi:hypothetical protein